MATTRDDIRGWLKRAGKGDTHMIVATDTFDYEDYPVFVKKTENVLAKIRKYNGPNMQTVMEVYDLSRDLEEQVEERRSGLDLIAKAMSPEWVNGA